MSFVCCISTTLFSEFSVVCKINIIWFGESKCFQDHWKKIPILVYIILGCACYDYMTWLRCLDCLETCYDQMSVDGSSLGRCNIPELWAVQHFSVPSLRGIGHHYFITHIYLECDLIVYHSFKQCCFNSILTLKKDRQNIYFAVSFSHDIAYYSLKEVKA